MEGGGGGGGWVGATAGLDDWEKAILFLSEN